MAGWVRRLFEGRGLALPDRKLHWLGVHLDRFLRWCRQQGPPAELNALAEGYLRWQDRVTGSLTAGTRWLSGLGVRRVPAFGLDAWVGADAPDCFAVALSYPAEGPGSISLSLFGRELPAGRTALAEAALSIGPMEK